MAYTTINKSTDYFNTKLYTGTGSSNAQTGIGFQPDLLWIKQRNSAVNNLLHDSIRGVTKLLVSNSNAAEDTNTNILTSFDSDGFTVGTNSASNGNNDTYVAWNWKAGTTGSGNTGGSGTYKAYSYSVNTTAGFSIVKYVGNGTGGHTIPHHLGVAPSNVIIKDISASNSWISKMKGYDGYLYLNNSDAGTSNSTWLPTDANNLTLANTWGAYNTNDATYIAYCFAEKTGYSKFGSYTGNGNSDGTFVYTGFKPAFFIAKRTSASGDPWVLIDNKRNTFNALSNTLTPSDSNAENTGTDRADFLSNGIKIKTTSDAWNGSGSSYIYIAFADAPLVGTNNVPCTAR